MLRLFVATGQTRRHRRKFSKFTLPLYPMIPPTARTCPNEGFWSNFACFGSKTYFLKYFRRRSASFFGQETHEHVKTIKKHCLKAKNEIFRKSELKKVCCPYVFVRLPHFGSKIDCLMKFLDDSAWLCLEKLKKHVFQLKTLIFDQKS